MFYSCLITLFRHPQPFLPEGVVKLTGSYP
jgi:hypothetical protein